MHLLSGPEQAGMVIVCPSARGNCTRSASDGLAEEQCTFCPNGEAVVVFRGVRQGVGEMAEQVGGTVEAQLP
jgi:hypothetical protein